MTKQASTPPNKPVDHVRMGPVHAAIWRNVSDEGHARFGVSFERRYRDSEGNWHSASNYSRDDLLLVAKAADLCHTRICELQAEERSHANADRAQQPDVTPAVRQKATRTRAR